MKHVNPLIEFERREAELLNERALQRSNIPEDQKIPGRLPEIEKELELISIERQQWEHDALVMEKRRLQQFGVPHLDQPPRVRDVTVPDSPTPLENEIQRRTEALEAEYRVAMKALQAKAEAEQKKLGSIKFNGYKWWRRLEPELTNARQVAGKMKAAGLSIDCVTTIDREFGIRGLP